jgi:hypothetical protein
MTPILLLDRLHATPLVTDPFDCVVVPGFALFGRRSA